MGNYVAYHVHTYDSLLDSCTSFQAYVDKAVKLGQKAIAFTEHGKPTQWIAKKMYCDDKGIKYIHGVECYLTKTLSEKVRDNYHTILLARDYAGVLEINKAISISTDDEHKYYMNRISFDEFLRLSSHVIKISACLASPLNKLELTDPWYEKLVRHYDFLEIQPHNHPDQISFNQRLAWLSSKYNKPLIAATDTHSVSPYKAECRQILMDAKKQSYGDEDSFDLTYKSYRELIEAFRKQDAIPENLWMQAIQNTNVMLDMVEEFELDTSFKYPLLYGSREADREKMDEVVKKKFKHKLDSGVIPLSQKENYEKAIQEELRVFDKIEMTGYILCMSELISWCIENGIPVGPARGSVAGSRVAYVTDIIDLNPETWNTVFSRFANEDRKEIGDIDVDVVDTDRPRIFKYLIDRFGVEYTARVPTWTTAADANAIELIGMAFKHRWEKNNPDAKKDDNPYRPKEIEKIKKEFASDPDRAKKKYPDLFYYHDGILGTKISQSVHAAGIVVSPITLPDHYGVFWKDGELLLNIDMDEIHEVSLVKFDLLVLNNIGIIKNTCDLVGIPYPRSHEINWDDPKVWEDMMRSPVGIFQMEGDFAFKLLKDFGTKSIFDMALVTACIRPSGASYRNELIARVPRKNPSPLIDELLKDNNGYLIFQEDTIKFLQQICGMSGSESDNVRRAIGRKDHDRLQKALPTILDGYCSKSDQPRDIAEQEAQEFLQIIQDSADYQFSYNHAVAYCLIGYLCAWLRCYYPGEFITTYLNHAKNDSDITGGTELASIYGIKISPPRFEHSGAQYVFNKEENVIAKGIASIKGYGVAICEKLYNIGRKRHTHFVEALSDLYENGIKEASIEPLLKIDYFASFGNVSELSRILTLFEMIYPRKTIDRSKVDGTPIEGIVKKYSTWLTKSGAEAKRYTIINKTELLIECEEYIKNLGLEDISLKVKMGNQQEILGYVDITTGERNDRRKILITDIHELLDKKTGSPWGYRVGVQSVGTGNRARLTVPANKFKVKPFNVGDILFALPNSTKQNKKGYWYLYDYEYVV